LTDKKLSYYRYTGAKGRGYSSYSFSTTDMYESFDASYEDTGNTEKDHQEFRMAHVQHETLQILVSFLTPYKEA
jgi:hypothetical protein